MAIDLNFDNRRFNKKLAPCFYREIQFSINYEARERGLRVFKVNPRGTSFRCLTCDSRLVENGYRTLKCSKCSFIGNRDVATTINLYMKFSSKYSRCGESRVSLNALKPDETLSGMQGNKDEAMKLNHINPHKS